MKLSKRIIDRTEVEAAMFDSTCRDTIERSLWLYDRTKEKYTHDLENDRYFINSWFPSFPGKAWDRMHECVDKISRGARTPYQADIVVTGRCHCDCWHCFRSKHDTRDLPLNAIKKFITQAYDLGTTSLGITGGEPMLREDIVDILRCIPDGMEGQLYTTGFKITKDFIRELKHTNMTRCIISLDHYQKDIVCARRRNPNAFDDALNAIALLYDHNVYTTVTLCMTEDLLREEDIRNYFAFVSQLGIDEVRIIFPIPQGNLEGKNYKRLYLEAMRVIKKIKAETHERMEFPNIMLFGEYESPQCFGCGAGANYVALNNDGNITPCVAVPLVFGNIEEQSLADIFQHMGKYFENSGRTCYGKRVGALMEKEKIDTSVTPLPYDVSQVLAEQCRVSGKQGDFFQELCPETIVDGFESATS